MSHPQRDDEGGLFVPGKDAQEGFMVHDKFKEAAVDVVVKTFDASHHRQSLFVDLTVPSLGRQKDTREVSNGGLSAIRQAMAENCADPIRGSVAGER